MATTRVLVLRHGQSEWNAVGRWQGQADPPLSELGRRQAGVAASRLGDVDAIVSSDLQRAGETAEIIAGVLGVGPIVVEPDLRERSAGEWSGLTRAEIESAYPGYLGDGRRPPGWEDDDALLGRALRGLGRVAALAPGGEVLVVSHGGVVYALEAHLGFERQHLANVGGRWFDVDLDTGDLRAGDRVVLVDGDDATLTVPSSI